VIEFVSIVVLTFALALVVLGAITIWLERKRERLQGIALTAVGLVTGITYAFLGSRFSEAVFRRLIVHVDLPKLMATAFIYTAGVLGGTGLAAGLFLWATGRFRQRVSHTVIVLVVAGIAIAAAATCLAVFLGPG